MDRFRRLELDQQLLQATAAQQQQKQEQSLVAPDEKDWIRLADQKRRSGDFEEALRFYSRALELDKSLVNAWVGQVQMLIALEEHVEAELWARKALEIFKGNADLMAARAQALCRLRDLKQAQAVCDASLAQQGASPYPWVVRGELMLARSDHIEEYCFSRAIQLNGDWLQLLEIAVIYLYYRHAGKALARVRQAVERAPQHAYGWYLQGLCEESMGLNAPACRSYRCCLEFVPDHSEARRHLIELESRGWSPWAALRRLLQIR